MSWDRYIKNPDKRFKVEIKNIPARRSYLEKLQNIWPTGVELKYSIEFHDRGDGNKNFYVEVSKDVMGIIKQICNNTNFALLYLKHENDTIRSLADAKVMHSPKHNIKCLDFSKDYRSLIKKVKANRI